MDVNGAPTPPPPCVGDYLSASSADCGVAMIDLCTGQSLVSGAGASSLLDPNSNCAVWKAAVEAASLYDDSPSGGQPYLDSAMRSYCGSFTTADECMCVNFPLTATDWCTSSDCGGDHSQCALDQIAQSGGVGGTVEVLQFADGCNPYPCWLSSCYDSNALLPSDVIATQLAPNGCSPWCLLVESLSTYSINLAPMPPGSWDVEGSGLISKCGDAIVGPQPFVSPIQVDWSANSLMLFPLAVSNVGDLPLILSLSDVSAGWSSVYPDTGFVQVAGRTTRRLMLEADQPTLNSLREAEPGGTLTTLTSITWTYPDAEGDTQTYTTVVDVQVFPPHPPIVRETDAVPRWAYYAVGAAVLLILLLGAYASRAARFVRRAAGRV